MELAREWIAGADQIAQAGPEVIKLLLPNSAEHEIYPAHNC